MNDFSKKLRRGAEVTTCLLALALCASFALGLTSCENGTAAPMIITAPATTTPATGGEDNGGENSGGQSASEEPTLNFLEDWEKMEFLYINNSGTLDFSIAAPWNKNASLTLMSDSICYDVKKNDGWQMAFSLMNKDGYPDANYFGLYNKFLGILRIYYYCNVDVAGSGSDFAFEVILETESGNSGALYNSLRFGIPANLTVSQNKDLLNNGVNKTFHFLLTPYSEIGQTTLRRGWHAFDIDLSSYTGSHFITDGASIQIACKTVSNSSVSLGTQITGKIDGDMSATIKKDEAMAKASGFGGLLSKLDSFLGSDKSSSALASIESSLCKGFFGSLNKYQLWAHSVINAFGFVSDLLTGAEPETPEPDKYTLNGTFDLKLNAVAETTGYITALAANTVSQVTVRKEALNQNSNIGSGVWQITNSPVIYFLSDRVLSKSHSAEFDNDAGFLSWYYTVGDFSAPSYYGFTDYGFIASSPEVAEEMRLPYFYDPTSFEVSINPEVFPDARNVKVLSYCGIYVNQSALVATEFRNFVGLGKPEVNKIFYCDSRGLGCPATGTIRKFKDSSVENYANLSIKFYEEGQALPYRSCGQENEIHYYGQVAEYEKGSTFNFMIEPQIFYPYNGIYKTYMDSEVEKTLYSHSYITEIPEMYVVVVLQFEAGDDNRRYVFSRVYLPDYKNVDYVSACTIANQIKSRTNARGNIVMANEYVTSINNRLQILGQ